MKNPDPLSPKELKKLREQWHTLAVRWRKLEELKVAIAQLEANLEQEMREYELSAPPHPVQKGGRLGSRGR